VGGRAFNSVLFRTQGAVPMYSSHYPKRVNTDISEPELGERRDSRRRIDLNTEYVECLETLSDMSEI
jgi:hypothetical protein